MLKGTRVDGIYTADPEKDPTATKFSDITYDEVLKRGLKVMDLTATCMCKENNLPIVVFDMDTVGNIKKVISGEEIGTVEADYILFSQPRLLSLSTFLLLTCIYIIKK